MDLFPQVAIERFEQLKPGDLFLVELLDTKMVALRAVDDQRDGDKLMILLGPNFPAEWRPGFLAPWHGVTVVSLGTNYTLELPCTPDGWSSSPPPPEVLSLLKAGDEVFVRGYFQQQASRFAECLVNVRTGAATYQHRPSMPMYASRWAISLRDPYGARRAVLAMGYS